VTDRTRIYDGTKTVFGIEFPTLDKIDKRLNNFTTGRTINSWSDEVRREAIRRLLNISDRTRKLAEFVKTGDLRFDGKPTALKSKGFEQEPVDVEYECGD